MGAVSVEWATKGIESDSKLIMQQQAAISPRVMTSQQYCLFVAALVCVFSFVNALSGREKCDACLTVMDEQQVMWEEYAAAHPAEVRKGRFTLTDEMDKKIVGMCKGKRYERFSKSMQEGCTQLTSNVKMKVVKPFLQGGEAAKLLMNRKWHACHQWCFFNKTTNIQYYQYSNPCETCVAMGVDIAHLLRRSRTPHGVATEDDVRRVLHKERPDICEGLAMRHERGPYGMKEHCDDIWSEYAEDIYPSAAKAKKMDLRWVKKMCISITEACPVSEWQNVMDTPKMPHHGDEL